MHDNSTSKSAEDRLRRRYAEACEALGQLTPDALAGNEIDWKAAQRWAKLAAQLFDEARELGIELEPSSSTRH